TLEDVLDCLIASFAQTTAFKLSYHEDDLLALVRHFVETAATARAAKLIDAAPELHGFKVAANGLLAMGLAKGGDATAARARPETASRSLAATVEDERGVALAYASLAGARQLLGDGAQATELFAQAEAALPEPSYDSLRSYVPVALVHIAAGNLDRAVEL